VKEKELWAELARMLEESLPHDRAMQIMAKAAEWGLALHKSALDFSLSVIRGEEPRPEADL